MLQVPSTPIAERLRVACAGKSCAEIGALTHSHPETVRRYLATGRASAEFLGALCLRLNICGDWLLTGRGEMVRGEAEAFAIMELSTSQLADMMSHAAAKLARVLRDQGPIDPSPANLALDVTPRPTTRQGIDHGVESSMDDLGKPPAPR